MVSSKTQPSPVPSRRPRLSKQQAEASPSARLAQAIRQHGQEVSQPRKLSGRCPGELGEPLREKESNTGKGWILL